MIFQRFWYFHLPAEMLWNVVFLSFSRQLVDKNQLGKKKKWIKLQRCVMINTLPPPIPAQRGGESCGINHFSYRCCCGWCNLPLHHQMVGRWCQIIGNQPMGLVLPIARNRNRKPRSSHLRGFRCNWVTWTNHFSLPTGIIAYAISLCNIHFAPAQILRIASGTVLI